MAFVICCHLLAAAVYAASGSSKLSLHITLLAVESVVTGVAMGVSVSDGFFCFVLILPHLNFCSSDCCMLVAYDVPHMLYSQYISIFTEGYGTETKLSLEQLSDVKS